MFACQLTEFYSRPRRPIIRKCWGPRSVFAVNNKWVPSWLQRCMYGRSDRHRVHWWKYSAECNPHYYLPLGGFCIRDFLPFHFTPSRLKLHALWANCSRESQPHGSVAFFCLAAAWKQNYNKKILDATAIFLLCLLHAAHTTNKQLHNAN